MAECYRCGAYCDPDQDVCLSCRKHVCLPCGIEDGHVKGCPFHPPAVSPQQRRLGERVRAVREGRELSREALASASHLEAADIEVIERGERVADLRTLEAVATALSVDLGALLED